MEQETCCAKLGAPGERNGMEVCGKPVEYREFDILSEDWWEISGWYHIEPGQDHHAVPASYAR